MLIVGITIINLNYLVVEAIRIPEMWAWLTDSIVSMALLVVVLIDGFRKGMFVKALGTEEDTEDNERWDQLFQRIDKKVRVETLYLNVELRVDDLADLFSTNSRYISQAVNTGHGNSVSHYLNSLRLEQFKHKLADNSFDHLTIDAIAQDCGFNSKSTAHRFFKAQDDMTPSEYRDWVRREKA